MINLDSKDDFYRNMDISNLNFFYEKPQNKISSAFELCLPVSPPLHSLSGESSVLPASLCDESLIKNQ